MIPIHNVYYMLSYAFQILNEQSYKSIATEQFHNTTDLMAAILSKGIATQIKCGLGKEYILRTEALSSLRGKMDITESIKTQTILKKQMRCTYDEFSVNGTKNRIIKSTLELLLKSDIPKYRKKELRKLIIFFSEIENIDLHSVNWNIKYDRNNKTYRMLISICYLVVNGLLQTNLDGNTKIMDFLDEQSMFRLYEKFILGYYKKHYAELSPSASRIPWSVDNTRMLPIMLSDIHLQKNNTVLIIDAKYYSHTTQVKYDNHTLHSNNMYQIFTYVKNCDYAFGEEDHKVSGMLLYAKTDEEITLNQKYTMSGNQITVKTLDLNIDFGDIRKQLDEIVDNFFNV